MKKLAKILFIFAMCATLGSFVFAEENDPFDWVEIGRKASLNLKNFEYSDSGLIGYWIKFEKNNGLKSIQGENTGYEDYYFVSNCKDNTITYLDKISYNEAGQVIGTRKSGSDFPNVAKNPGQYRFEEIKPGSTEQYVHRNACLVYDYVTEKGNEFNRADLAKLFAPVTTQEKTTTTKTVAVSSVYDPSSNPDWHKISTNKYFDLNSIKTNGSITSVWVKEFNDGSFAPVDNKKILYSLSLIKYDCVNKKTMILRSIDYDLQEKSIRDFDYSNFAIWKISPVKNADLEYAFLCSYKKN